MPDNNYNGYISDDTLRQLSLQEEEEAAKLANLQKHAAELEGKESTDSTPTSETKPTQQESSTEEPKTEEPKTEEPISSDPNIEIINGKPFYTKEAQKQALSENISSSAKRIEERLSAPGQGVFDWIGDLFNNIPGVNIPRRQPFEDKFSQGAREISEVVIPTIMLSSGLTRAGTAAHSKVGWSLGNDKAFKWFAGAGIGALSGGIADQVSYTQSRTKNLQGEIRDLLGTPENEHLFGVLPPDWSTLDSDSPDVKRSKNRNEGIGIGIYTDLILGAAKMVKASVGMKQATKWVPENEKAKGFFKTLIEGEDYLDESLEEWREPFVWDSAKKRSDELDELGAFNFERSENLDEPLLGVHDLYDYTETGIRTADDYGVVGASVDTVRISKNIDTSYGRVGSVVTESALKHGLELDDAGHSLLKTVANQLQEAGEYGYQTATGRYISHDEILEEGDRLAADLMKMDVAEMKRVLDPDNEAFFGVDVDTNKRVLKDTAYAGVFKAIKAYMKEFANMDQIKANAYLSNSFAGQVSDLAEGVRLMDGTAAVERAGEQIIDRLRYLMMLKGQASYVRGRGLSMINLWKGLPGNKNSTKVVKDEKANTLKALEDIQKEVDKSLDTIMNIQRERPQMLGSFMLAYEMTDGKVDTMGKLNDWMKNSTGTISKAFIDGKPELPSAVMQGIWGNIYNSVLSAFATPIKAVLANTVLMAERPIATFAGALATGDKRTIRRGWYQYSALGDTLQKGFSHMNQVFRRASQDPESMQYLLKSDFQIKNEETITLLREFANASEEIGEYGPTAMVEQIEALNDLAEHPWLRFGINAMSAMDGFTRAVIGNVEARGRAFDKATFYGDSELTEQGVKFIADEIYKEMFDKNGVITDKAVDFASREISLNLNTPGVKALSALIDKAPAIRPFMMFPKTSINMMRFTDTHSPFSLFVRDYNDIAFKPKSLFTESEIEDILTTRGIPVDEFAESSFDALRAEIKGRKAIGTLSIFAAGSMFMNDRLRGNGHFDKQTQNVRRELGWKPRTYKALDGKWYSYDNIGAVSDYLAIVADVMDNFDTLNETDLATNLNRLGFILSANLTNKSFLAGLEPMFDVLSGNAAAGSRWAASFGNSLLPLSGQRNELARLLQPQLKVVEQDVLSLSANRNPGFKSELPDLRSWIDGKLVGKPTNFFTRLQNTYLPWKVSDNISPESQFLVDIEYDSRPSFMSDGKGTKYDDRQRSELYQIMGETGYFAGRLKEIMKVHGDFVESFKKARAKAGFLDKTKWENVYIKIDAAMEDAKNLAQLQLSSSKEVQQTRYQKNMTDYYSKRGNIEAIQKIIQIPK